MAKQIFSMSHLVEQIERPVYTKPSIAHTQVKPQPATVSICASCKHQSADNFDVCNNSAWEGGPVGGRFVMWSCSGHEAKTT